MSTCTLSLKKLRSKSQPTYRFIHIFPDKDLGSFHQTSIKTHKEDIKMSLFSIFYVSGFYLDRKIIKWPESSMSIEESGIKSNTMLSIKRTRAMRTVLLAMSVTAASAIAAAAFFLHFNLSTAGSLELLLVVLISLRYGFLEATVASLVSAVCLNYLFTAPLFKLSVSDPENWISLAVFEATSILVSRLSSQARMHAAEVEVERSRNAKLYELSRAILLIDSKNPTGPQLSELIRELIEVDEVDLWAVYDSHPTLATESTPAKSGSAHQAYLFGEDRDEASLGTSTRILRTGTTPIGAMILRGWRDEPELADAVASLIAVALERARAMQKESRAEAERNTEQLRTAVLDGLAHGFKTPLTAIQTASSGLLAMQQMTETQTELISIIDDQATVLNHLTTRLLQTAALEAKEVRLRRTTVSVNALLHELVEDQDEITRGRVRVSVRESLEPISVDAQLLKLALMQLVDNAAKYATVGPMIDIDAIQTGEETLITVSNEGLPILPDERERIFQRFYRGLDSAHRPTGTGLGLSIVRKIAEAHGGRAWVDSEGGTTHFSLAIPRLKGTRNG
ncbi:ATP-binding protein [Granulicella sp. WH15]|uniref:sensor histidine kinase n=1 Tax=Granulicella sp. WH15 TaxID=2602070 RepID=UPI0013A56D9E|nr:ATP-binding protein [Granulicella sp. WH15]